MIVIRFIIIASGQTVMTIMFQIGHALRRLAKIHMTVELLSETGVGKAVNQLRGHEQYGTKALRIVEKWKDIAKSYGLKQRRFMVFRNTI